MALPNFFERVDEHLDEFINDPDESITVFHEIESPDFHLDVYWIKPGKDRDFSILMTNGISGVPLNTPKKQFTKHIELCILLPPDWKLENDEWKKPENYWPIELLKDIGRYPSENDTWLGYGHTIPTGEPIIGTEFMSVLLVKSKTLSDDFQKIKSGRNTIELYTIFPLYLEEMNYKINNGTDKLLELFDQEDISDIIDTKRRNVCEDMEE